MSLASKLKLWLARRLGRLDEVNSVYRETDGRYIDAQGYARVERMSVSAAREELRKAAEKGYFRRMFLLHPTAELPIAVVVEPEWIGETVELAELGYVGEDMHRAVHLSRHDATEIFVAPETPQEVAVD